MDMKAHKHSLRMQIQNKDTIGRHTFILSVNNVVFVKPLM